MGILDLQSIRPTIRDRFPRSGRSVAVWAEPIGIENELRIDIHQRPIGKGRSSRSLCRGHSTGIRITAGKPILRIVTQAGLWTQGEKSQFRLSAQGQSQSQEDEHDLPKLHNLTNRHRVPEGNELYIKARLKWKCVDNASVKVNWVSVVRT